MKKVHIVAFQAPYPADYGGVIDLYYKAKSLKDAGCYVILHCFCYAERGLTPELEKCASEIYLYKRKVGLLSNLTAMPYIVKSRQSDELIERLKKDDYPILFEGIHCTYYLNHNDLKHRFKIVRCHNVEHEYYRKLAESTSSFLKKMYYSIESLRLKYYEKNLIKAQSLLAISNADKEYFSTTYKNVDAKLLPCFHGNDNKNISVLKNKRGQGGYILYHGNLSVEENILAVEYLLEKVIPHTLSLPWIVAGKDPSEDLRSKLSISNIELISNPTDCEMQKLVAEAKANILITFQETGIKLKLLIALYSGAFCIVNPEMVANTGLEDQCFVCNTDTEIIDCINELSNREFTQDLLDKRLKYLSEHYNDQKNIEILIDLL